MVFHKNVLKSVYGISFQVWLNEPGLSDVSALSSSLQVMLKSGTNILYWRTTGILMGSKAVKPVLVKNITIEGIS